MTDDLEAVNTIAQTAASDAVRALTQIAELRVKTQYVFTTMFALQAELLAAVEWLQRDGADQDACEKAKPHVERARRIFDAVTAAAEELS